MSLWDFMINDTHDHMVGYVGLYLYIYTNEITVYNVISPKLASLYGMRFHINGIIFAMSMGNQLLSWISDKTVISWSMDKCEYIELLHGFYAQLLAGLASLVEFTM